MECALCFGGKEYRRGALQGNTLRSGESISLHNSCQTAHHISENMLMNASCSTRHLGFKSLKLCSP